MATNTTNFNMSKPEYTDTADIAVINSNMDKVDTSLQGLGTGLAIISNANTHAAITSGQYVYVHGHGSLAEGLYTAKSNISANATLSTSNLQAVSGGGLNALNSKTVKVKRKIGTTTVSANSYTEFKLADLGFTTPSGYSIAGVVPSVSGTGTSGSIISKVSDISLGYVAFQNTSGSSISITYAINVIYTKSENIETI